MDSIANLLVSIKNAGERRYDSVRIPFSKINLAIADILQREGYLGTVTCVTEASKKFLDIKLKYIDKRFVIRNLKRVSKPGRRVYQKAKEIKPIKRGLGLSVISTSSGLMTNREARRKGLGGEVLIEVF